MNHRGSRTQTLVGFAVLGLLCAVAAGVFYKQSRYDVSVFTVSHPAGEVRFPAAIPAGADNLESYLPDGMKPMSALEVFGRDNLSDKIDGKAELYLSSGFVSLHCRRFVKTGSPDSWVEMFVYDMGEGRNAFSVYSAQKRAGVEEAGMGSHAYRTSNALFFVHGRHYVEVVASMEGMSDELLAMGRKFVAAQRAEKNEELRELELFPRQGLDEGSVTLRSSDVFGFDRLDQTFIARYVLDGIPVTAFISRRPSAGEAEELAAAFERFLLEFGGVSVEGDLPVPGIRMVEILDTYTVVFSHGRVMAGVHECDDRRKAEELALSLYGRLEEVNR